MARHRALVEAVLLMLEAVAAALHQHPEVLAALAVVELEEQAT